MTNTIPPCPVCGTVPEIKDLDYLTIPCGCRGIREVTVGAWFGLADGPLTRALRTHGIHTLAELESRLAKETK